jgi:hypothetical protein
MSNSFSIAMVTCALYYLLSKKGITVSAKSPDLITDPDKLVNVFLYQITPNIGYRNMDLPARSYAGSIITKQQLGLDLHYLITAYGERGKDELAAHKLLGEVTSLFHENPVLTRDFLQEIITEANEPSPQYLPENVASDIKTSDLGEQVELVKLTMENLSLEDLTKVWSSFFKTGSYRISVAYKATVVLIDGEHEPSLAMPVRERNIYAIAPKRPEISYVDPQVIEYGAITVTIIGRNLKAEGDVRIDFGEGKEIENMPKPDDDAVSDKKLIVRVSSLGIGIHQVRVVHPLLIGTPETLHRGHESNVAFFAIAPKFEHTVDPAEAAVISAGRLTLQVERGIKAGQKVEVILGTQKPIEAKITSDPVDEIEVDVPQIGPGAYPVRLRVDRAETQPDAYFGEYMRPVVEVPP